MHVRDMEPLCWYWYFGFGHIFFPKLNRLGYNNLWYIPAHCIEKNLGREKQKLFAVFMPFLDATQHLFCLRKVNDRHEKCGLTSEIFSISCNIFPIEKLYDAEHRTFKTYNNIIMSSVLTTSLFAIENKPSSLISLTGTVLHEGSSIPRKSDMEKSDQSNQNDLPA